MAEQRKKYDKEFKLKVVEVSFARGKVKEDAQEIIETWKWDYNHFRPHSTLNDLTPQEFIILQSNIPETLI